MPAQREHYHHGDLRAALIEAATKRVLEDGIESISLRALARDTGVAHRAAYQHFTDKDALIAAVLTAAHLRLEKRVSETHKPAAPPEDKLQAIAAAYADFAYAEPKIFLAMNGPRLNYGGKYPALESALRQSWAYITNAIAEGARAGQFMDDQHLTAVIFWGGLQGVITQSVLNRIKVKPAERKTFMAAATDRLIIAITN